MIPARLGSKRVKHKNLRLLAGKPLVCHVADACKKTALFSDIYINSESELFKDVAKDYDIKFFRREPKFATDTATNDQFVQDFIDHVPCDIIIQVNPTSPFISPDDIKDFVKTMLNGNYDTLHSIKEEQIEGLYGGKPLNFDPLKQMPRSQDLKPVQLFVSSIMGWKTKSHTKNMSKLGNATYGGKDKTGYFTLKGFSTVDIDVEEDFQLAEVISKFLSEKADYKKEPEYYHPGKGSKGEHAEISVPDILVKDGVMNNDLFDCNKEKVSLDKVIKSFKGKKSWSKRLVNSESNSATLICQKPGEGNRLHYHPDWNEWWYIVDGQWSWEIEGKKTKVKKGDVVFIPKGKIHRIEAIGNKSAIRLAVSREDVAHVYPQN